MTADDSLERYSRQMRFYGIGEAGQRKLLGAHVTLCGCGALGTVLANVLVRAGVGHVRVIDRDFIETSNLQRQVLFDERDVAKLPGVRKLEADAVPGPSPDVYAFHRQTIQRNLHRIPTR